MSRRSLSRNLLSMDRNSFFTRWAARFTELVAQQKGRPPVDWKPPRWHRHSTRCKSIPRWVHDDRSVSTVKYALHTLTQVLKITFLRDFFSARSATYLQIFLIFSFNLSTLYLSPLSRDKWNWYQFTVYPSNSFYPSLFYLFVLRFICRTMPCNNPPSWTIVNTPCLKITRTPVILWHNFIKTALTSIILCILRTDTIFSPKSKRTNSLFV